ncbi:MAG TPA: hypothetical protein VNG33_24185 [Polyangiaceae bacterium]|nr:hypothetical protein [Polyangiaceae bacterium]
MSYELEVAAKRCPSASELHQALGIADLGGMPEDPQRDWATGFLHLFRHDVSTRSTSVAWVKDHVEITIRALAAPEDCELALQLVEAVAQLSGAREIQSENFGTVALTELRELHDAEWMDRQAKSGARVIAAMIDEGKGPMGIPGPVRDFWMGERTLRKLRVAGHDDAFSAQVLAEMRRVQWTVPNQYRTAGVFVTQPKQEGDKKTKLVIWLPDEHLVLSRVDQVALRAAEDDVVLVPFDALPQLAAGVGELLDECQWLVRPVPADGWARIVARAREIRGR